jgi:DNA-binding FadR family transcriptional regulator
MGGTFVAQCAPAPEPRPESLLRWRDTCDTRFAVELGVAVLAAERAEPEHTERLAVLVTAMERDVEDFAVYRQADVLFHIGLAETTGSAALVTAMTDSQGAMTDLFAHIAHPPEVLAWANGQHARLVDCLLRHDSAEAVRIMQDHLHGSEHVLAGLLP